MKILILIFTRHMDVQKGAADQYVRDYSRIFNINSFVLNKKLHIWT